MRPLHPDSGEGKGRQRTDAMNRMVAPLPVFVACLLLAVVFGCGENRRLVDHECISFTLSPDFDYAFFDENPDAQPADFPVGNQMRVVVWDKESPHNWLIFIYFPLPADIASSLKDAQKKLVNGVEVLSSEIEGFRLQIYQDPRMSVGIASVRGEVSTREAQAIVQTLKVKNPVQD